jgi:hypothetical protein
MLCRKQGVSSDVKLSIFVQKRLLDVFLDDIRTFLAINVSIFAQVLDVIEVLGDLDTCTLVSIFTRLDDPMTFTKLCVLI